MQSAVIIITQYTFYIIYRYKMFIIIINNNDINNKYFLVSATLQWKEFIKQHIHLHENYTIFCPVFTLLIETKKSLLQEDKKYLQCEEHRNVCSNSYRLIWYFKHCNCSWNQPMKTFNTAQYATHSGLEELLNCPGLLKMSKSKVRGRTSLTVLVH